VRFENGKSHLHDQTSIPMAENTKERATCWALTINNPTEADEECIALARQKGWKVDGQMERGESGTLHYQIMLKTPQVRFSAVKKAFPRAHIEQARKPVALAQYVHKVETRVGELAKGDELYPSLSKFWDLILGQLEFDYAFHIDKDDVTTLADEWFSLDLFDSWCRNLIEKGYHVETMAVNPQVRSAWLKFGPALVYRSLADRDRQTDTEENNVAVVDIPTHATSSASSPSGLLEGGQREEEGSAPSSGEGQACHEDSDSGDC